MPTKTLSPSNTQRALAAKIILKHYKEVKDGKAAGRERIEQSDIDDLMTDIRHYCNQNRLSFGDAYRMSEVHYHAELAGED